MKTDGRYNTSGLTEDSFEPGSDGNVLKNKLGITDKGAMDELEAREQLRTLEECLGIFDEEHCFTANELCRIHAIWLGDIYEWAGKYRQVNISKGGFPFAMALHIPNLMQNFEQQHLQRFTPCQFTTQEEIIQALAVVHTELVLIHPFREGNGRLARILATLMGLQAGLPPLDYSIIADSLKPQYFAAVQAGMDCNYEPMEKIFRLILQETLNGKTE